MENFLLKEDLVTEVADYISDLHFDTPLLNNRHTQMIIEASAGDLNAKKYIKSYIKEYLININEDNIDDKTEEIFARRWGLGYLEKYYTDEYDELEIIGTKIILTKKGEKIIAPERFKDESEAMDIIRRSVEFDKSNDLSPANCILMTKRKDGARVTVTIPPASRFPELNIRKFDSFIPTESNYLESGFLNQQILDILKVLVKGRSNMVVIGEQGSGKTTLQKLLVGYINDNLKIGLLETHFESYLSDLYPNKIISELQETNNYKMKDIFPVMLRKNIGILMVGESRSYEISELLKSMTRGQSGSMGTGHSITPVQMVHDFAIMLLESGITINNIEALKHSIASAVDIVIQTRILPNGDKILQGIYESKEEEKSFNYGMIPIVEFKLDGEVKKWNYKNSISEKLKEKLVYYGAKYEDIERVFK
jgi:pilus assembly protein CpaF